MDFQTIYYVIAALLVIVGVVGTVLPALPGLPLVFVGMALAAWAGHFEKVSGWLLLVLGLLTLLSLGIDLMATAVGAKRVGASKLAILGAILGTFAGLFFMPIGLFAGPFVGALAGEYAHSREVARATKVGFATWLGILIGVVLKLGLAFVMIGLFAVAWFVP